MNLTLTDKHDTKIYRDLSALGPLEKRQKRLRFGFLVLYCHTELLDSNVFYELALKDILTVELNLCFGSCCLKIFSKNPCNIRCDKPGDFRSWESPQTLPTLFIDPFEHVERFRNLNFAVKRITDIQSIVFSSSEGTAAIYLTFK